MSRKKKKSDVVDSWLEGTDRSYFDRLGAKSDVERQRARRAKLYEIGPLPEVEDKARRESCRFDFLRFILTYCRDLLDHEPSTEIIEGLIKPIERAILHGGLELPVFGRGIGKTTIIKCAIRWAFAYGHKRFIVVIAATKEAAVEGIFRECIEALGGDSESDDGSLSLFAADFPGLALPIAALDGNVHAAAKQTVNMKRTDMRFTASRFRLPSARGLDGRFLEPSHGAIFIACSMLSSLKGLVKKNERPDFVILDDPETEKQAASRELTDKAERFIKASMGKLFSNKREPVAVMAITPIQEGDLCTRFMDRKRHGEWHLTKTPVAQGWNERHESLAALYKLAFYEDIAAQSIEREISRAWYLAHKEEFADIRPVDPKNFTPIEVDAVHHILNDWCRLGDTFAAECQLDISSESNGAALSAETVKENLHDSPRMVAPDNLSEAVAFVDVNISKDAGLRYGVAAFGPGRRAAIIDYGRYPRVGERLYPVGSPPEKVEEKIFEAIGNVVKYLVSAPYTKSNGERLRVRAICFDAGYEQRIIVPALKHLGATIPLGGTHLYWSLGFGWSRYRDNHAETLVVKDHMHVSHKKGKDKRDTGDTFLAFHADYWRDVAQSAYRVKWPLSGSLSLFRPDSAAAGHEQWANETTYEKLIRTYVDRGAYDGMPRRAWEWFNAKPGHNHSMDIAYSLLALAHFEGIYTAKAPVAIVSQAASDDQAPSPSSPGAPSMKPRTIKRPANRLFGASPFKNYRPMGGKR